jgi:hypothetical protein
MRFWFGSLGTTFLPHTSHVVYEGLPVARSRSFLPTFLSLFYEHYILFVYTHLFRVGVWIGYPHTLDIEILRLK